jgi:hypothetical protein
MIAILTAPLALWRGVYLGSCRTLEFRLGFCNGSPRVVIRIVFVSRPNTIGLTRSAPWPVATTPKSSSSVSPTPKPDDQTVTPGVYVANFTGNYSDPSGRYSGGSALNAAVFEGGQESSCSVEGPVRCASCRAA